MAEWLMAVVLKTAVRETVSGVRIPLPPPPPLTRRCLEGKVFRRRAPAGRCDLARIPLPPPTMPGSVPSTSVTDHADDMGNTRAANGFWQSLTCRTPTFWPANTVLRLTFAGRVADPAAGGDGRCPVVPGVVEGLEPAVGPRGWDVALGRDGHAEGLVRPPAAWSLRA